ncbi:hypothetical protein ABIA35_005979 [Catenulispora sp. MAP12-49]|uniref:DUF6009 family protein n=1 Tax=unclassified Catenulispora TaxID=414885 RepID=UPI003512536F
MVDVRTVRSLVYLIWQEKWGLAKVGIGDIDTGRVEDHQDYGFIAAGQVLFGTRDQAEALEDAVLTSWRNRGLEPVLAGDADYERWKSTVGGATETVSLDQAGSLVALWDGIVTLAEAHGDWITVQRFNNGSPPSTLCCPPAIFRNPRDLDSEELRHESQIMWLEPPEKHEYVRQRLYDSAHRKGHPADLFGMSRSREIRLVGYAELVRGAPSTSPTGPQRFRRRAFYVTSRDRSSRPDGAYRMACPIEAVDPLTVAERVSGRLTDRAWGGPIPPPVRIDMPCPWRHRYSDDPLDRPCQGNKEEDPDWWTRWHSTW